jgi:hypothetical protein
MQFSSVDLGDQRRTRRAVKLATAAALHASDSLPKMCKQWHATKAAYRFFDQKQVTFQALTQPHRQLTLQAASACAVALHVSDTTTLSFSFGQARGLGPTSAAGSGHGVLLHSTLALDVSGGMEACPRVLGLSAQQWWARESPQAPRPESSKWSSAIQSVQTPAATGRQIHVGDCESDCWEAIESCRQQGLSHVIRSAQDRRLADDDASGGEDSSSPPSLFERMRKQPALGQKRLLLRSRGDQQAREVQLHLSAMRVTLLPPKNWSSKTHRQDRDKPAPIECWAVRVWESDPPAGAKAIEWILLTDIPVNDPSDATLIAFWYSCRWLIEEYHKCLKTGCKVEERQLETADRLAALTGILSVVAVRLLQLKQQARCNPEQAARKVVPVIYVQVLAAHRKLSRKMNVREFWHEVAKLGGFLGRKSDGDPGWLTTWRGWHELELLVAGAKLRFTMRRRR